MIPNWSDIDRRLMGHAWVGSEINDHVIHLCDQIGVRWAGTKVERQAADYVAEQLDRSLGASSEVETFDLESWQCTASFLTVEGSGEDSIVARPCLFCPSGEFSGRFVDVGFGMPHELSALAAERLKGSIALLHAGFEPFSEPVAFTSRISRLAEAGVSAAITASTIGGRRTADFLASDWRNDDPCHVSLPVVQVSREDAARLRRRATGDTRVTMSVEAQRTTGQSWNVVSDLVGSRWPEESLVAAAHHDTTTDSFGANDNAAGVAVLLETARLVSLVSQECDTQPGRTIRFVSFGAEEQGLQGSRAFVARHYGTEPKPRLMVNLDELATGPMKGVVLQFPHLRQLVQSQLDSMQEGLACHVLDQLDASGDMFPFTRAGIPSSILWRWRFVGRHPDTNFGHTNADTPDKLRLRDLKEYTGYLSRLLLRLSLIPPNEWPAHQLDTAEIECRLEAERGSVFRTM